MHVGAWFERLAGAPGEPRDRLIAALAELGPDAGTVFTPLPDEGSLVEAGVLARPMTALERDWRARIAATFANLELPSLPPTADPQDGRTDHGPAFTWLHGEFTMVRSTEPGAVW
jgi:1,2-phenylacetyl-CoA epoxidase catalytic subunit